MSDIPVPSPSDQDLIAAANRGDAGAFEALYKRYREWVVNLACRFTRDRDLAHDVMQETFIYLLRKFPGFELVGGAKFKTFLYPVVRHTALALGRKARQLKFDRSGPIGQAIDPPAPPPDLTHLHATVQALDSGHREVLLLRFADSLSLQEIALALEIPLGTVKSRLHHALAQLRQDERLREYFNPP